MKSSGGSKDKKKEKFMQLTTAGEKTANFCLSVHNWKLEEACDSYFSNPDRYLHESRPTKQQVLVDRRKVQQIYEKYKDPTADCITVEGIIKFAKDVNMDLMGINALIFNWRLGAAEQGKWSREEFVNGVVNLGCDSLEKLRQRVLQLDNDIRTPAKYKDFYGYVFNFAKEASAKSLNIEHAIRTWEIVLVGRFPLLEQWSRFLQLQRRSNEIRGIPRDTWNLLLDFAENVKTDLTNYNDEDAWPVLIDEFVLWARDEMEGAGASMS